MFQMTFKRLDLIHFFSFKMENKKRKSKNKKTYFKSLLDVEVSSFTKPDDNRLFLGTDPEEFYALFNGNAINMKKNFVTLKEHEKPIKFSIDSSELQWYLILALKVFIANT